MATSAGMMATAYGISAASSLSSSYAQSQAMKAQAQFSSTMSSSNAKLADISAQDAIARGEKAATLNMSKVRSVIGSQRASFAAQGVDVNSGSAAQVQQSTAGVGALDSMNIRNNAMREAMGYKIQAVNYSGKAQFDKIAGETESENTLLTGGMGAISSGAKAGYWAKQ